MTATAAWTLGQFSWELQGAFSDVGILSARGVNLLFFFFSPQTFPTISLYFHSVMVLRNHLE